MVRLDSRGISAQAALEVARRGAWVFGKLPTSTCLSIDYRTSSPIAVLQVTITCTSASSEAGLERLFEQIVNREMVLWLSNLNWPKPE